MLRVIILLIFTLNFVSAQDKAPHVEANHSIHEELRGLLRGIETAVNSGDYEGISPFFHEELRITTINQETITSRKEIAKYFESWLGPDGFLKAINIKFYADELTQLYADNTYGIVRGHGDEEYILSDGRSYQMKVRWTATVVKDVDGKWRILALHTGTNFLNNPILTDVTKSIKYFSVGGVIVGILIGCFLMWLLRRVKKPGSSNEGNAASA